MAYFTSRLLASFRPPTAGLLNAISRSGCTRNCCSSAAGVLSHRRLGCVMMLVVAGLPSHRRDHSGQKHAGLTGSGTSRPTTGHAATTHKRAGRYTGDPQSAEAEADKAFIRTRVRTDTDCRHFLLRSAVLFQVGAAICPACLLPRRRLCVVCGGTSVPCLSRVSRPDTPRSIAPDYFATTRKAALFRQRCRAPTFPAQRFIVDRYSRHGLSCDASREELASQQDPTDPYLFCLALLVLYETSPSREATPHGCCLFPGPHFPGKVTLA